MSRTAPALPPDAAAASRWHQLAALHSAAQGAPWLHEEAGLRLAEHIQALRITPRVWLNTHAPAGGTQAAVQLQARWPDASCLVLQPDLDPAPRAPLAPNRLQRWRQWLHAKPKIAAPPLAVASTNALPQAPELIWANMQLHQSADAPAQLRAWHAALAPAGVLALSCLGPGTLAPLRAVYAAQGWGPPLQALTDMHDLGDALVQAGFATPVVESETLTLTYSSAQALLQELRQLGRNLHPQRFAALRGRAWLRALHHAINSLAGADGRIAMPFDILYAHAFKPAQAASQEQPIRLDQLHAGRRRT